jgi:NADH-quinone oxidoreductase subunit C
MADETYKETLPFLFTSAEEPQDEGEDNPHAKDTTACPEVIEALRDEFEDQIRDVRLYANEHTILVETSAIVEVCRFLKEEQGFEYLTDLGGVDRFTEEERFEVVYNLIAIQERRRLRLKVRVGEEDPTVPSVTDVYQAANWNEREAYDMFGIVFVDHPDLRRMYMPEDFEHHPLRKEFPSLGIPGSLPLPAGESSGEPQEDPFPSAHGSPPVKDEDKTDSSDH